METFFNNGSMTMTFHILNVLGGYEDMHKMGGVRNLVTEKFAKTYWNRKKNIAFKLIESTKGKVSCEALT